MAVATAPKDVDISAAKVSADKMRKEHLLAVGEPVSVAQDAQNAMSVGKASQHRPAAEELVADTSSEAETGKPAGTAMASQVDRVPKAAVGAELAELPSSHLRPSAKDSALIWLAHAEGIEGAAQPGDENESRALHTEPIFCCARRPRAVVTASQGGAFSWLKSFFARE
jgi:hypothetical protein